MNGHRHLAFGVSIPTGTGNLCNRARSFKHFTRRQCPSELRFSLCTDFHCLGEDPVLRLISKISVSRKSNGELGLHHGGGGKPVSVKVVCLIRFLVRTHL